MSKIQNFSDAFEYVNSRYVYNSKNYPAMEHLTQDEAEIFALKHGLLHLLKSVNKIGMKIPFEKQNTSVWEFISRPDEEMSTHGVEFKRALLKTVVSILSICNTVGMQSSFNDVIGVGLQLTEKEMIKVIPVKQLNKNNPIVPTFVDSVHYLINELAVILEEADHSNLVDPVVFFSAKNVFLSMVYWFNDPWLPDFLNQIPAVM